MTNNFNNIWNLWYHHEKDNWSISGYKKIYTIKNTDNFWTLFNNWNKLGGIYYKHFFIMKDGITPIWEDPKNKKGGCWSFKVNQHTAIELWENISMFLVTENISNQDIVGLSICLKKNNNIVIKIWNTDSQKNSLSLLNEELLKKWGTDIIYIAHMPDKS
jgi:L-rhamnose mutarotase